MKATVSATAAICGAKPNPEKLMKVLRRDGEGATSPGIPTLDIYEASRDLQRAQNQPWFKDYLHPTLEKYFEPNPANHGSYFFGLDVDGRGITGRKTIASGWRRCAISTGAAG